MSTPQNKKNSQAKKGTKPRKVSYTRLDTASSRHGKASIARSAHMILFTIAGVVLAFAVWASHARINEVTKGTGTIIPPEDVKTVQGIDKGEIRRIFVREGQKVKRNDKLVSIVETDAESAYQAKLDRYKSLRASIIRLQAEAAGKKTLEFPDGLEKHYPEIVMEQRNSFEKNRQNLADRISVLKSQIKQKRERIDQLQSQSKNLKDVIELSRQEKNMIRPLIEQGSAPEIELIKLRRQITQNKSKYSRVKNSIPEARSALQEIKLQIRQARSKHQSRAQEKLSEQVSKFKELDSELRSLRARKSRTTLKAPVSGRIKAINDNVGGVVEPGEKLIEIVPDSDKLMVEAKIKPKDISFVHPGQKARIKITAYDFTVYGQMMGKVKDISPDSFKDKKGNIFYKVKVTADRPSLEHKGRDLPLKTGMTANVSIISSKRTIMDYILKPFRKTFANAMQEH